MCAFVGHSLSNDITSLSQLACGWTSGLRLTAAPLTLALLAHMTQNYSTLIAFLFVCFLFPSLQWQHIWSSLVTKKKRKKKHNRIDTSGYGPMLPKCFQRGPKGAMMAKKTCFRKYFGSSGNPLSFQRWHWSGGILFYLPQPTENV